MAERKLDTQNGSANAIPPDAVGVVYVSSSPPKAKLKLSSVTQWMRQMLKLS